jgi:hypothetical protein
LPGLGEGAVWRARLWLGLIASKACCTAQKREFPVDNPIPASQKQATTAGRDLSQCFAEPICKANQIKRCPFSDLKNHRSGSRKGVGFETVKILRLAA